MNRFFTLDMPFWRFAGNTLIISCLSLAPLLLLYITLAPGFITMLSEGGPALSRFLRQVITNGLPVVFVVNYISFFLYALMSDRRRAPRMPALILLLDPPARIIIFVVLHGVIYFLSADWFGSFGGDHWQALRVVAPTLVRSAYFENLSGVYLYATLVSALPLYTAAFARVQDENPENAAMLRRCINFLPGNLGQAVGRVVIALILFAISASLLTGLAALIVWLQRS